jgi:hypothetical protein
MHSLRSKTHILGIFTPFRCSKTSAWFRTTYFTSKTHVFGWFHAIYSMHPTRCGNWYRGAFDWMFKNSRTLDTLLERFQCTPLGPKLIFWVFSDHFDALKCPFGFAWHTLGLKLMFWVVSCHFVAAPNPLWKSVSGALNARVYASETISCFCRNEHAQSTISV